jgi:hypothetical protein
MTRLRRASVIVTLSLLAWAATASAACAWVSWAQMPVCDTVDLRRPKGK